MGTLEIVYKGGKILTILQMPRSTAEYILHWHADQVASGYIYIGDLGKRVSLGSPDAIEFITWKPD